jgi:hypothetical protein
MPFKFKNSVFLKTRILTKVEEHLERCIIPERWKVVKEKTSSSRLSKGLF